MGRDAAAGLCLTEPQSGKRWLRRHCAKFESRPANRLFAWHAGRKKRHLRRLRPGLLKPPSLLNWTPQLAPKAAALAGVRIHAYTAPHAFDGLLHDGEPDAGAFVQPGSMQTSEHVEQALLQVARNPDAIV